MGIDITACALCPPERMIQYSRANPNYPIKFKRETKSNSNQGIIQRQLVTIDCTPDAGVVSVLFGFDSHTICPSNELVVTIFARQAETKGRGRNVRYR
jgi:hypothetical protein